MRTQLTTIVNELVPARAGRNADNAAPRHCNVATSYVTTPEKLATWDGQFFLYRRKAQMLLDDGQLSFTHAGTTTVIPLPAIHDLSIGRYPRLVNPVGLEFISVTYDEGGQTKRLFFSPFEGLFGFPSNFNRFVEEWYHAIRVAIVAATGLHAWQYPRESTRHPV